MDLVCCAICQDDDFSELGEIDSCNHRFCYPCIRRWSAIENKCPLCKVRLTRIVRKLLATPSKRRPLDANGPLPGKVLGTESVAERNQRVVFEDPTFVEWIEGLACVSCGSAENEDQLLLCDECDQACHTYCAGLEGIPEGDWFCGHCTAARAAREHRRRHARPSGATARATVAQLPPPRSRPATADVDLVSEDDADQSPAWRQRRQPGDARAQPRQRSVQSRRAEDPDLDNFIISDDDDESDPDAEFVAPGFGPTARLRAAAPRRQPRGRQRLRQAAVALPSEDEEVEWVGSGSDASEATTTAGGQSSPEGGDAEVSSGGEGRRARAGRTCSSKGGRAAEEEDVPLAARLLQRGRAPEGSRLGGQRPAAQPFVPRAQARSRAGGRAAPQPSGPTAAQRRAVEAISRNWGALRDETATFEQVLGMTGVQPPPPRQQVEQQRGRRRRLVRVRELDGSGPGRQASAQPAIDLASPTPPDSQRRRHGGQRRLQIEDDDGDDGWDQSLLSVGAKLRRELVQCRANGAQLLPRTRAGRQRQASAASAASTPGVSEGAAQRSTERQQGRMRTVGDLAFGASVAHGTPSSVRTACRSGPRPGGALTPGTGSGWQPGQRIVAGQRFEPSRDHTVNPFNRFQFGSGRSGSGDGRHVNSDGRSSPKPLRQRLLERSRAGGTQDAGHAVELQWQPPPPAARSQHLQRQQPEQQPEQQRPGAQLPSPAVGPTPSTAPRPHNRCFIIDSQTDEQPETIPETDPHVAGPWCTGNFGIASPGDGARGGISESGGTAVGTASQPASPGGTNAKAQALTLVKVYLGPRFDSGVLSWEQYKAVAKAAVHALYRGQREQERAVGLAEAEAAVEQAMQELGAQ